MNKEIMQLLMINNLAIEELVGMFKDRGGDPRFVEKFKQNIASNQSAIESLAYLEAGKQMLEAPADFARADEVGEPLLKNGASK